MSEPRLVPYLESLMVTVILSKNGRGALVFVDLTDTTQMDLTNAQGDLQGQFVRAEGSPNALMGHQIHA